MRVRCRPACGCGTVPAHDPDARAPSRRSTRSTDLLPAGGAAHRIDRDGCGEQSEEPAAGRFRRTASAGRAA